MNPLLTEALDLYNLKCPQTELIRHNENITYKIIDTDKQYVLRIHKPTEGFYPDFLNTNRGQFELIQSELDIISSLKNETDLSVQTPICGINSGFVQSLADGTPVTLLEWIEGQTIENVGLTPDIYKDSGKLMANMHTFFAQSAERDKRYSRYSYDQTILPSIAARIENAVQIEMISNEQAKTIINSLDEMRRRFDELDNIQEKHIVHADLGKSNVIIGVDGILTPIDFSLCGYSHFYMDLGGIYGLNFDDEGRKYIIEGYKSIRNCEINPRYIEPYFALSVVLFIACQYERAKKWDWFPGNMERWCRDIFKPLVDNFRFISI